MANNVIGGQNNVIIAVQSGLFTDIGLNTSNTGLVYEVGVVYKSWTPGLPFNPINSFSIGKGYLINAKLDMDLTAWFAPPVFGSGSGAVIDEGIVENNA